MKASDVILSVAKTMNDLTYRRFTLDAHYAFLTEGLLQCVFIQPRANAKVVKFKLTSGNTFQNLPDDAVALIDIVRNLGADGQTPGAPIIIADRQALDGSDPKWHSTPGDGEVTNFVYDDRSPNTFYVYPYVPNGSTAYVEMIYAPVPTTIVSMDQDLDIQELYRVVLVEYQLSKCFGLDVSSDSDAQKAQQHLGLFYSMLGERDKAQALLSPNNPNNVTG